MDLKWLEDFLSLSRTGNFRTSAAERCVSQPAFSRRIQALETWAGAELIDRSETPARLTAAGVAFRRTAEEMLALAELGRGDVRSESVAARETLRITTLHTLSFTFLPHWLRFLEQRLGPMNGNIKVAQKGMRSFWTFLDDGATDFVVCYDDGKGITPLDNGRIRSLTLGVENLIPVAAAHTDFHRWATFFARTARPVPFLRYPAVSWLGRIFGNWLERNGLDPNLAALYEGTMPESLKEAALAGRGVAWLPNSCIRRELEDGRLVPLPDERHIIPVEIRIFRSVRKLQPHVEKIWEGLTQIYETGSMDGGEIMGMSRPDGSEGSVSQPVGLRVRRGSQPNSGEPERPHYRLDGRTGIPKPRTPGRIRRR